MSTPKDPAAEAVMDLVYKYASARQLSRNRPEIVERLLKRLDAMVYALAERRGLPPAA